MLGIKFQDSDGGRPRLDERVPVTAPDYTRFAPGVPHLANLPLTALQRTTAFLTVVHLTNLPWLSRQGAAATGEASKVAETAKNRKLRITFSFIGDNQSRLLIGSKFHEGMQATRSK